MKAIRVLTISSLFFCGGCGPRFALPEAAEFTADALREYVTISGQARPLGDRVYDLGLGAAQPSGAVDAETCEALWGPALRVCRGLEDRGLVRPGNCSPFAVFFFAHDTPRCALRFSWGEEDWRMPRSVLALDINGAPVSGYAANCGNGVLDPGEVCDDGNHNDFDACDASCQRNGFQGCETVIEHYFAAAQVAHVDAGSWSAPRSHLMAHADAAPMRPLDASLCSAAEIAADNTCDELRATMPFIAGCSPTVHLAEDGAASSCAVRFSLEFRDVKPENSIFTTHLDGLMSFAIR